MTFKSLTESVAACLVTLSLVSVTCDLYAFEILGTGTESLIGGDLTDPENDGDPEDDIGYDAVFRAADEEGFGGGESAFNVFDNVLGPGNDKWCCGPAGGIPEGGLWVEAELSQPYFLTRFTVSSANDVPGRDPLHWAVQGSNDGETYTTIFEQDDIDPLWDERLQVIQFSAGDDFPEQDTAFQIFRHVTFNTQNNPDGAFYQLGELEFFGETQSVTPGDFNDDGSINLEDFLILSNNFNQSFTFDVSFSKGDMTRNGTVDLADFLEFRDVFATASQGAGAAAVPEPASFAGLAIALMASLGLRRRR